MKIPAFLVSVLWLTTTHAAQSSITVEISPTTDLYHIKHCFTRAPHELRAHSSLREYMNRLSWRQAGQSEPLVLRGAVIDLPAGQSGCVSYQVDHRQRQPQGYQRAFREQHPQVRLLDLRSWLLSSREEPVQPLITINHPEHIQVSAPWALVSRTVSQTVYRSKPTPQYARGFLAIGHLHMRTAYLGTSRLRLAIITDQEHQANRLEQWLKTMAGTVADLAASFPLPDVQVLVIDMPSGGEPVPWGQVNRAGGQGVLFVVNSASSDARLYADWTAAHEFSHLLTPYTPYDRWLSEGFASYHQNITRLRSGLLDERTAWGKLLAGFERGQKAADRADAGVLKHAGRRHNMQMYWGGAVIALKAEVALQQQTQGRMNLSKALAGLQDCCLNQGVGWRARSLFQELDRITGTRIFTQLYEDEVKRQNYPEYAGLLRDLGISKNRYGQLRFDDQAPLAYVRKNISNTEKM